MDSETLLAMDPMDLLEVLNKQVQFEELTLETEEDYHKAAQLLNHAASFICYFKEMETIAKIQKRNAKRDKLPTEEVDRCMGVEEVFECFKRIAEQRYDTITRIFTSKRLSFEELKIAGNIK